MTLRNRGGECNPYQQQSRIDLEKRSVMAENHSLQQAQDAKKDEFYTHRVLMPCALSDSGCRAMTTPRPLFRAPGLWLICRVFLRPYRGVCLGMGTGCGP